MTPSRESRLRRQVSLRAGRAINYGYHEIDHDGLVTATRSLNVGPLAYLSMRFSGGIEMTARHVFAGRWSLSVGPEDGLTEGLMAGARVRWLKGSYPQVMLVLSPRETVDA